MPRIPYVVAAAFTATVTLCQTPVAIDVFLEKPYLQLGNAPKNAPSESLVLVWHTDQVPAEWKVELRTSRDLGWRASGKPISELVAVPGIPPHLVYHARMTGLVPGEEFHYRVLRAGKDVFSATGTARKSPSQAYRFVVFGDCGAGTPSQPAIAYRAAQAKPDFIFIPGDIVYSAGRIAEYRQKFFPIYNAEEAAEDRGAPLLRSVPFIAAPGNHDIALQNFDRFADALAYFYYWDQPLNGPLPGHTDHVTHTLTGNESAQPAFRKAAGNRYPRMANFSFDYGNSHWTVLDSNPYMDWTNADLRKWITQDLAMARSAAFRFVAFHHPGFNSSTQHFNDQWMRLLSPVFEAGHVDIVFAGHVHNYQRSFPLTFVPQLQPDDRWLGPRGEVRGEWKNDTAFADGANANPRGVIYLVSGAGGAGLYDPVKQSDPSTWQGFTYKYIADEHSLSVVDIDGGTLRLKQITESGKEVDHFQIVR